MLLTFKRLRDGAKIPVRATEASAGIDLSASLTEPVEIPPHAIRLIPTGLAAALDEPEAMSC